MTKEEQQYREYPAIHFSLLSKVAPHPDKLNQDFKPSNKSKVGKAVDKLLFEPEDFASEFQVLDVNRPSDAKCSLIDKYVKNLPESWVPDIFNIEAFEKARKGGTLGGKKSSSQMWEEFTNDPITLSYIKFASLGEKALYQQEYYKVQTCREMLINNEFFSKYFNTPETGIEIEYQYPIYSTLLGEEVKALLDILYIDHNKKTIEPIDLKVHEGNNLAWYPNQFFRLHYYIQEALYHELVKKKFKNLIDAGYTVKDFSFIVQDANSYREPVKVIISKRVHNVFLKGNVKDAYFSINGVKYPNLYKLIEDYKWHINTGLVTYPKDIYQNNGSITIT